MRKSNLKYRDWLDLFCSMASRLPMPRYFLRRTPSEKKYSPGASDVPAKSEPIITGKQNQTHDHVQPVSCLNRSFIHCRHLYSASSSGTTQKRSPMLLR